MKRIKAYFRKFFFFILVNSLKKAAREQGLDKLVVRLEDVVPDISGQYSTFKLNSAYMRAKVRNMHAFQIALFNRIVEKFQACTIVDLGDSSGTHLQYIIGLNAQNKDIKCLSVNLDAKAVERIKAKGLDAINARIEDLDEYSVKADIIMCFETLEHLMDPCSFLYQLSLKTGAEYLIVTVPYLKTSRVGLHHIREDRQEDVCAENTHIFEFSPEDWRLILKHSGWSIVEEKIYLQYPKRSFFRITKPIWKRFDYEGFYGFILKRNNRWSSRYMDWKGLLKGKT
ncbi:MAG: methyltransferase domain-containing protein [Candidatus Omnitrophota bacterium]|nr:methyltransferase domain-containing protein [Candidatus Omnitrophota bacterium]